MKDMAASITEDRSTMRYESDGFDRETKSVTILFAEAVASSAMERDRNSDSGAQEAISRNSELAAGVIGQHDGQVIRTSDGSVLAEFSDPACAVQAAIEIERVLAESSPRRKQLGLRIGIFSAANADRGIDVFGEAILVAASITREAGAGQVLISRDCHEAASIEPDLKSQWFRRVRIDGREDQDIFEVNWAEGPSGIPSRYKVLSRVGSGGMGIVYKAHDTETDEIIALKTLKPGIGDGPKMQEDLRREVCLARKVTHKNVCRIHELSRSNGVPYISMEFVEGESLLARLRRTGALPWHDALKLAQQICAGLREAHIQGIVHTDLKPANIMLDRCGSVKIMDFGIAQPLQGAGQGTSALCGTPAYMAPEQVELKRLDARTDIYALGLLLYEMTTGAPPFEGESPMAVAAKQLQEVPECPRDRAPEIPVGAEAVILKCLEKEPAKRFQSVDELWTALRKTEPRRASPLWESFVADFRTAGNDLCRDLGIGVEAARDFVGRQMERLW
jgi:class 3 adenylate cyclase